jgi:hypothetical protein
VSRPSPRSNVGYRARRSAPINPPRRRHANRSRAKANFVRSNRTSSMDSHIPRMLRHQSRCGTSTFAVRDGPDSSAAGREPAQQTRPAWPRRRAVGRPTRLARPVLIYGSSCRMNPWVGPLELTKMT